MNLCLAAQTDEREGGRHRAGRSRGEGMGVGGDWQGKGGDGMRRVRKQQQKKTWGERQRVRQKGGRNAGLLTVLFTNCALSEENVQRGVNV